MTQAITAIASEVRERVTAAAVELYEHADRQRFPTVDAVRRLSRADMNTVSLVMKEWRQSQTRQVETVAVAVPEAIQQANSAAVAALWLNATELANQSLRSAQKGWEKERAELDDMRAELAGSYETQAAEFEIQKKQLADNEVKTAEQAQQLAAVRQSEAEAVNRAERAEARAADLRAELDRSIQQIDRQQAELTELRTKAETVNVELITLRTVNATTEKSIEHLHNRYGESENERYKVLNELKNVNTKALRTTEQLHEAEADRDAARKEASTAREEAAKLAGKLEATQTQAASLIDALATRQQAPQAEAAAKPAAKPAKKTTPAQA